MCIYMYYMYLLGRDSLESYEFCLRFGETYYFLPHDRRILQARACCLFACLLGLFLYPENGKSTLLGTVRNVR